MEGFALIEGKKILLFCKEEYSFPLYFVIKKLMKNNEIAVFWSLSTECALNKNQHNCYTYYWYKKNFNDKIKFYDVKEITDEFIKNKKSFPIDWDYIRYVEKEYTHYKGLNLQLMSSQFTSRYTHYREYFVYSSYEENIYWLELNYKNQEKIINSYQPDLILDLDNAELQREIFNEISYRKKIPYITICNTRYENYVIPVYDLGLTVDKKFIEIYNKSKQEDLSEEYAYIKEYEEKKSIMPEKFKGTITAKYKADNISVILKRLIGCFWYNCVGCSLRSRDFWIRKKSKFLFPSYFKLMHFFVRREYYKKKLYTKNGIFENPVKGEKYIYVPLHLIPESTTSTLAPLYVNEISNIEKLSKLVPVDTKIYVKEHQAMLGERPLEFYKKIKKIPNVRLVQLNYYEDPKPWIVNSCGVYTITGTAAFEAAILGKRAITMGNVPFNVIEGIYQYTNDKELEQCLRMEGKIENKTSCAAYMKAIKKYGFDIDYTYIIKRAGEIIMNNLKPDKKFEKEIDKLILFYEHAYVRYVKYNFDLR